MVLCLSHGEAKVAEEAGVGSKALPEAPGLDLLERRVTGAIESD
jgi:hypothetical protein